MQKSIFRKGLVLAIIVLFVGASITPSISGDTRKTNSLKNGNKSINSNKTEMSSTLDDPTWQWAVSAGGTSFDYGDGICIDSSGNTYITGNFRGSASFGSTTLNSQGVQDIFVAKLDSNGNWQWAVSAGGGTASEFGDQGRGICVDSSGNTYITGLFSGSASFGSTILTCSNGWCDVFVAKLDSNGNWQWAVSAGGSADSDNGKGICVDSSGHTYITGDFHGSASFGSTILTSSGGTFDVFVAKLDSNGNWQWAVSAGGNVGTDGGYGICVDSSGHTYITGSFKGSASFGSTTLTSSGNSDVFVAKLSDGTGPQPLIIEDNWILPSTFNSGDNIIACTFINNTEDSKNRDSEPFSVRWLIDDSPVCTKNYDSLPSGRSTVTWPPECLAQWPNDYQSHPFEVQIWRSNELLSKLIKDFSAVPDPLIVDGNGPYYHQWIGNLYPSVNGKINVMIQFYGDAYGGSSPYTYQWDFGDGCISSEKNPIHIYTISVWEYILLDSITFNVYLLVEDDIGNQNMDITTVCIGKSPSEPLAHAGGPYFAEPGETINFDGSKSFDPDGEELSYYWDFGDNSGYSTEVNPSYVYPSADLYTVTLSVTDPEGKTGIDQTVVDVGYFIEFKPPDGYESASASITKNEAEWGGSTYIELYPTADHTTGEMSMHISSGAMLAGSAVIAGKCQINGPTSNTFSVLEPGKYDISFNLNSSGETIYNTPTDIITEGLIFLLTLGTSTVIKTIAKLLTRPGATSSQSYTRGFTNFYEDEDIIKSDDFQIGYFRQSIITPGNQKYSWDESYEVNFQRFLYSTKNYRFEAGLDIQLACGAFGLDACSYDYQTDTNFSFFKAMKIPENFMNGGYKKSKYNESITANIDSSVSKVDFLIRWVEGSDLDLTLKRPDGFIIDPDFAMSDPDITYISESTYEMYTVTSPMYGEWELLIDEVSVPPGGVDFIAKVSGDTGLFTNFFLDIGEPKNGACKPGDKILVSLNISNLEEPVTGANVVTEVQTPTDSELLVLYDDGMHNDSLADDGIYANIFTNTSVEGFYNFTSTATGLIDGYQFSRTAKTQAVVMGVLNQPPDKPDLNGPNFGDINNEYLFEATSTDPESNKLFFWFDWGDGSNTSWLGPFESGETCNAVHSWSDNGTYAIYVKVKDEYGFLANTSEPHVFYVDHQPGAPIIDGPVKGGINTLYTYEFISLDEDNDDLYYFVDWDDGTDSGWIGPYKQNENCNISHEWTSEGTYTIKAKAKDVFGAESDWAEYPVTMPRDKVINRLLLQFLQSHPNLFPILRQLQGL